LGTTNCGVLYADRDRDSFLDHVLDSLTESVSRFLVVLIRSSWMVPSRSRSGERLVDKAMLVDGASIAKRGLAPVT